MKINLIVLTRRGFALVVTLSLMILLTIIAVGLLTLSTVSLRSVSQGSAAATAQANARLALMLALGELQKNSGPDQRITAPANAVNSSKLGWSHRRVEILETLIVRSFGSGLQRRENR